ncbi:MAG: OmpA family protein [Lysobacterales bacterium]
MKHNRLYALIALSLAAVSAQAADEYSKDWFFTVNGGVNINDDDRSVHNDLTAIAGAGFGRYLAPKSTLEFSIDYTDRDVSRLNSDKWSSTSGTVSLRHFLGDGDWQGYLMGGGGVSRRSLDSVSNSVDFVPVFQVGGGVQNRVSKTVALRGEIGYRFDFDDEAIVGESQFGDVYLTFGAVFGLTEAPAPVAVVDAADAPVVEAPPPPPVDGDDDNDGVLNSVDKCPNTPAGEAVGPDGCPIAVVIDLRGVNFAFDKAELTAESITILDQAVDALTRYPALKVEVAGHTDSIGTEAYNQGLSERRARVVYDYLTGHGISADRLSGPTGYGETRPIDSNATADGRARNRRTELSKQQ